MDLEFLFWLIFAAVVAHLGWRYFSNGRSLTGALLGGRVNREVDEIRLSDGSLGSQVLRVLEMESSEGQRFIALAAVSKAPLAASLVPYRLGHSQAQQLITLLQRATGAQGGA